MTALAMDSFARSGIEIAVIETGLGGRLDATNVLKPLLTITTSIDHDHNEILGSSLQEIAAEKAGIIKPGVPHLAGLLPVEAMKVIQKKCREQGADLHRLSRKSFSEGKRKGSLWYRGDSLEITEAALGLSGPHQRTNAALAVRACELLAGSGVRISKTAVRRGLASVNWPGRFQRIQNPGQPTIILDVCHNASGARAFAETFTDCYSGRKCSIIIGLVRKKEHQQIIDALIPIACDFNLVPLKSKRTTDLDELLSTLNWRGVVHKKFGRLRTAYRHLLNSSDQDDIICVVGSHYLVGEYLKDMGQV